MPSPATPIAILRSIAAPPRAPQPTAQLAPGTRSTQRPGAPLRPSLTAHPARRRRLPDWVAPPTTGAPLSPVAVLLRRICRTLRPQQGAAVSPGIRGRRHNPCTVRRRGRCGNVAVRRGRGLPRQADPAIRRSGRPEGAGRDQPHPHLSKPSASGARPPPASCPRRRGRPGANTSARLRPPCPSRPATARQARRPCGTRCMCGRPTGGNAGALWRAARPHAPRGAAPLRKDGGRAASQERSHAKNAMGRK